MKIRFDTVGYPLYCDAGPYEGDMRIDLAIRLYLPPEEYARYQGPESLHVTLGEPGTGPLPAGSTAEPSGDRPGRAAGGDVRLGARSLSVPAAPGEPPSDSAASTAKEYRDGCP